MTANFQTRQLWIFVLSAAILVPAVGAFAADSVDTAAPNSPKSANGPTQNTSVDFFAAIRNGDLDVKFIPRDSRRAQVIVKNTTDRPLTVKLPDAFVGVPVLAQVAGGLGGNGNRTTNTNNNNKQNQGVGGGMGGNYGGAFSIPPERVVKMQLDVVCLDFGKPDPSPHVPYKIVPAEEYTEDPEVREVCRMLGDGQLDQRVAQLAAWHLANRISWDDLADLKTFPHFPQYSRLIYSGDEIHAAMGVVSEAIKLADARKTGNHAGTSAPATAVPSAAPSPAAN